MNEWSAKVHFMEVLENGYLGKSYGQPQVRSLKHVIMTDASVGKDGKIIDIDVLRGRFNRYYDKWFALI